MIDLILSLGLLFAAFHYEDPLWAIAAIAHIHAYNFFELAKERK